MLGSWVGLVAGLLGIGFGVAALWLSFRPQQAVEPGPRVVIVEVAEAVPEIDTEWKKRVREEQRREWETGFLESLGPDREEFMRQWADGSERKQLAMLLTADADEARRRRDWNVAARVTKMRGILTTDPEKPFSAEEMELMHSERARWHRKWAEA